MGSALAEIHRARTHLRRRAGVPDGRLVRCLLHGNPISMQFFTILLLQLIFYCILTFQVHLS